MHVYMLYIFYISKYIFLHICSCSHWNNWDVTCIGNAANMAYERFSDALCARISLKADGSECFNFEPCTSFFIKHHNLNESEAGPESWRVRCMSTQLIDEGDLINEMNNEQKRNKTRKWVTIWENSCFLAQGHPGRRRKSMQAKRKMLENWMEKHEQQRRQEWP